MQGVRKLFDSGQASEKNMSKEIVLKIACENEETRERRIHLKKQAEALKEALAMIGEVSEQYNIPQVSPKSSARPDVYDS